MIHSIQKKLCLTKNIYFSHRQSHESWLNCRADYLLQNPDMLYINWPLEDKNNIPISVDTTEEMQKKKLVK